MRFLSAVVVPGAVVAMVLGAWAPARTADAGEGEAAPRNEMMGEPAPSWDVVEWIDLPAGKIRHGTRFTPEDEVVAMIDGSKKEASGTSGAQPPPPPAERSPAAVRLLKRIEEIDKKRQALFEQEMDLRVAVMTAQQKAMQIVKDTVSAAKEISQGHITKPLRQYQAIMLACVQNYLAYDGQYAALQKAVQEMERSRAATEVQRELAALNGQIETKRRANLEQIAALYEKAGDFKKAVDIYSKMRASLPEDRAAERRALQEKIAGAYERCEDFKKALEAYNEMYEAMSPAQRKRELDLRRTIGNLYRQIGDLKKALIVFEAIKSDLKPGQTFGNLDEVIKELKQKLGK